MSESKPFFSIIIPTYNHSHLIGKCIESLLLQTYTNWEAIIVNNFSTDNTIEVVEKYNDKRIRLVNFDNNGIIAVSRNIGIKEAIGEWICFLDSDDWWASEKLKTIINYVADYDFICHDMIIKKAKKTLFQTKLKTYQVQSPIAKHLLINSNCIPNSSVSIRRSIVDQVGFLKEDRQYIAVEDFDYWIRTSLLTDKFIFIPKSLGFYWIGQNVSMSLSQVDKEMMLYANYRYMLNNKEWRLSMHQLEYNKAVILQSFKEFNLASKCYFYLLFSNSNLVFKFKVLVRICMCIFKYR